MDLRPRPPLTWLKFKPNMRFILCITYLRPTIYHHIFLTLHTPPPLIWPIQVSLKRGLFLAYSIDCVTLNNPCLYSRTYEFNVWFAYIVTFYYGECKNEWYRADFFRQTDEWNTLELSLVSIKSNLPTFIHRYASVYGNGNQLDFEASLSNSNYFLRGVSTHFQHL